MSGTMHATDRRYALVRLAPGDWLWMSDDRRRLYRLVRHPDGSWLMEDWPSGKPTWAAWEYRGDVHDLAGVEIEDWDQWDLYAAGYATRRDALAAAIAREARSGSRPGT